MNKKQIKPDHMSYVSSILDCSEDSLIISEITEKDLSSLQKFATLNFKDNSQAHLFLGQKGKKYINMKNASGVNMLISSFE